MAETDHLTGLLSRAAFDVALATAIHGATPDVPAALEMTDIDHFKSINDRHGHPEGDRVLKLVATTIRRVVQGRGQPIARRFGCGARSPSSTNPALPSWLDQALFRQFGIVSSASSSPSSRP